MVLNTVSDVAKTVSEAASSEPGMGTVVAMGVGIVFAGLVILVFITWFMGLFFRTKKPKAEPAVPAATAPVAEVIPNKQEMLAAISAVVAEELGRDVSQIKILSFKKM